MARRSLNGWWNPTRIAGGRGLAASLLRALVVCAWLLAIPGSVSEGAIRETESKNYEESLAAAMSSGDWEGAVQLLEERREQTALTGQEWLQLGIGRYRTSQLEESLEALAKAESLDSTSARLLGTRGTVLALLGRKDAALDALEKAVEGGMPPGPLQNEAAFDPLRDAPRFKSLVKQARERAFPCESYEQARQFDFWIGSWEVYSNGTLVGSSEISSRHNGCLIFEDYTAGAFTGQSFNYFDGSSLSWKQVWIDGGSRVIHYEGGWADGAMRLEGVAQGLTGGPSLSRMTFTPNEDGSVRQLMEGSTDGGKTWTVGFDGRYVPKKE